MDVQWMKGELHGWNFIHDDVDNDVGHDVKDVIHNITSPFHNEFHKSMFGYY